MFLFFLLVENLFTTESYFKVPKHIYIWKLIIIMQF